MAPSEFDLGLDPEVGFTIGRLGVHMSRYSSREKMKNRKGPCGRKIVELMLTMLANTAVPRGRCDLDRAGSPSLKALASLGLSYAVVFSV